MESFAIYCTGCSKVIGEAYAKEDSGVAKGDINDAYYCADCAEAECDEARAARDEARAEREVEPDFGPVRRRLVLKRRTRVWE